MNATDIAGYTYRAENVHPQCLHLATGPDEPYDGWALAPGIRMSVEDNLREVALAFGIDRLNERSFDSEDFPKVIFCDQVAEGERCDRCESCLLGPPAEEPVNGRTR